ncbi:TPA: hypothetical protein I8Y18_003449 [Raoultella ornithinolytica]|nr:hypothetical protein [Raoultella ornithinolytica]
MQTHKGVKKELRQGFLAVCVFMLSLCFLFAISIYMITVIGETFGSKEGFSRTIILFLYIMPFAGAYAFANIIWGIAGKRCAK